ncbi:MAG: hypothetical protein BroJett025_01400 [Patescibacteria group bacterium]|nr:MAG: hypothetical protein BroJett025_01400 [Patescibacteria group bacterium]
MKRLIVEGERERQASDRKDALKQQFQNIEHRIKKSWELYKRYLRKNQPESAQKQKIVVYDALYDFFSKMYDDGLLIYLNGQSASAEDFRLYKRDIDQSLVDNFTQDLFVWFALTLGLVEVKEINEMVNYITAKFAQTVPNDREVQAFLSLTASGYLLN